jgi:hypothetical protein
MKRAWVVAVVLFAGVALAGEESEISKTISVPSEDHPFTFKLNGGVEGFSSHLAPRIDVGATYGVAVGYDASRVWGLEAGYSGAVHEIKTSTTGGVDTNPGGSDLMRNGGYFAAMPGLTIPLGHDGGATLKPYALGGIGADRYDARGASKAFGYKDQTVGNVPFGLGIQGRIGAVMADARFNYAWEFGNQFSVFDENPLRYQGTLQIGAAF